MPPPHSYTWAEKLFGFLKARWQPQRGDIVSDRFVSKVTVTESKPFPWPVDLANVRLTTNPPTTYVWADSLGGIPVQRIPAALSERQYVTFTVNDTYSGTVTKAQIPRPRTGFWVEGYPNPLAENGASGAWDNHVLMVCPETGEAWELIGVNAEINWCLRFGYWKDGKLVAGHSVVAGGGQLTANTYAPGDPDHELGFVMNDYQGADGSKTPASGWPTCGQRFRLSAADYARLLATPGLKADQRRLLIILRERGAVLYDRTGGNPSAALSFTQAGTGGWQGSTLAQLPPIPLSCLELVTRWSGTTAP